jgi:hypothetical protein
MRTTVTWLSEQQTDVYSVGADGWWKCQKRGIAVITWLESSIEHGCYRLGSGLGLYKSEKMGKKCNPKSKKGNKKSNTMESVVRILRITADFIVRPSHSDQETVIVLQTLYKHQVWLIAPKMLYHFLVTGMSPSGCRFELWIPCVGLCRRLYDKNAERRHVFECSVTKSVTAKL